MVAGTATAVSNRVSRRQANRWADQSQQQAYEEQAYQQQQQQQPVYQQPAPQQDAGADETDRLVQLQKLGELKAAGVLTDEEFALQKARILAK